ELRPVLDRDSDPTAVVSNALEHDHGLISAAPQRQPSAHHIGGTFWAVRDLHALTVDLATDISGIGVGESGLLRPARLNPWRLPRHLRVVGGKGQLTETVLLVP